VNSDVDLYHIYDFPWQTHRPKKQVAQAIDDETDTTKVSLERFKELVFKGVPQSLEALFANPDFWLDWHVDWHLISNGIQQCLDQHMPVVLDTYRRTARDFHNKDNPKKNRHALRLMLNARDLKRQGFFNPTLEHPDIVDITEKSNLPWAERVEHFKDVFYQTFGDID
jgi:hypothetical protein